MRRSIALAAALVTLALPRVAAAQTPSITPTPAPVMFTFRFDCGSVPWSCGDKPTDIRWQLWRGTKCEPNQTTCTWTLERLVIPNEPIPIAQGNVRLFLGPISTRAYLVDRCDAGTGGDSGKVRMTIFSWCSVNEAACAGPENWNFYGVVDGQLTHVHKHIGNCTGRGFGNSRHGEILTVDWGLPGVLAAAPSATITPPPPATLAPTVGFPTEVPTVAVTLTASPTTTGVPSATLPASPTASPSSTATPTRAALLLPILGR